MEHVDSPAQRESWLEWVVSDLDSNKEFLADGIRSFASLLLGSVECRDIPRPDLTITSDRTYLVDWNMKNGDRLLLGFQGWERWRYIIRTLHHKDGSIVYVHKGHIEKVRWLFQELFLVNSVDCDSYLDRVTRDGFS